ncbi:ABC transporter substrate-binding protein [Oceanotoga teriensis]|uniref:ABC transporter substrate-binding protein n=1 Tax=Oceanotoga teriensis TaxID=515440 RepID=UPI002713357E|nr:ABC transporter substrate-binding protein [Oceanotoga teriensis]MDO7976821.1 ABC transporter substrate-binding protein [Oceanotoga teriensis]
MKKFFKIFLVISLIVFAFNLSFGETYDRNETFVAGGGLWNTPTNWNPFTPWNATTGTVGLVYETLFTYDPLSNNLKPWLAEKGEWISDNEYLLTLKKGINWADGNTFDSNDVYFTFDISRKYELSYSNVWNYVSDVEIIGKYQVKITFKESRYHEWSYFLYQQPIMPHHIWENMTQKELLETANKYPMGTGMYKYDAVGADRMIWIRNENWWGNNLFGKPAPKRIVYMQISGNNVSLGMLMKGELDISNFFIPGVPRIKSLYNLTTYYKEAPYMLPENVAILFMDVNKKPMDDSNFRRAVSFAINSEMIAEKVYEEQVQPAGSTGLIPIDSWKSYIDKDIEKNYGFNYNPSKAKTILAENGYKDINKDGYVETPDGKTISLELVVPNGWTDWMEAAKIIASGLREVGINVNAKFPDYSVFLSMRQKGGFDMLIDNASSSVSKTPWTYWNWVASNRIYTNEITQGNWGRYENKDLFDLIIKFNFAKEGSSNSKEIASNIEKILLEEMPSIPLWYNGMWFQGSTSYWTNYPTEDNPIGYPSTWGGKWQIGGLNMLLNMKPAN